MNTCQQANASKALRILLDCLDTSDVASLVQELGGTKWSVPASGKLPEGHCWIEVLGDEKAALLAAYTAGEADVRIPRDLGLIDGMIWEGKRHGKTNNQLAREFKKDVRSIINAIKRHQQARYAGAQQGLFES